MNLNVLAKLAEPLINYLIKHPHIILEGAMGTTIVALILKKHRDEVTYEEKLTLYQGIIRKHDAEINEMKSCLYKTHDLEEENFMLRNFIAQNKLQSEGE